MIEELAARYKALGEVHRLAVLRLLLPGPRSATQLLQGLGGLSQPGLSRHIAILRAAGLIREEKRGRLRIYRLEEEVLGEPALEALARLGQPGVYPAPPERVDIGASNINTFKSNDVNEEADPPEGSDFQEWLR